MNLSYLTSVWLSQNTELANDTQSYQWEETELAPASSGKEESEREKLKESEPEA